MSARRIEAKWEDAPPTSISGYEMRVDTEDLPKLYRKLLDEMPEDATLDQMGLEMVVNKKPGRAGFKVMRSTGMVNGKPNAYLPMKGLVPWIHFNILIIAFVDPDKKRNKTYVDGVSIRSVSLEESYFETAIDLLGRTVGLHGLTRILLALLHYMATSKSSPRVERFASLIEKYLEEKEGCDRGFIQLPTKRLVDEVLAEEE